MIDRMLDLICRLLAARITLPTSIYNKLPWFCVLYCVVYSFFWLTPQSSILVLILLGYSLNCIRMRMQYS